MIDALHEVWDVLRKNALRTFLTGSSVAWGMFVLVVLLAAGRGLENGAAWEFRDDATNSLYCSTGRTSLPFAGRGPGREVRLTNDDLAAVKRDIPDIDHITGRFYLWGEFTVSYGERHAAFDIRGVHPDHRFLEKTVMTRGRFLNDRDVTERRKVAVIGTQVTAVLFGREDPIGRWVNIRGLSYQVVGEYEDVGGENELRRLYVPITTAQLVYNQPERLHHLLFTIGDADVERSLAVAERARTLLADRLGFSPEDRRALRIQNNLEQYSRLTAVFRWLRVFVWVVGVGTLLAGIVGISNIMLISVAERTKEIGIRKALGATPGSIIRMVLVEAVALTAVSGYAGLLAGVALIEALRPRVSNVPFLRNPEVSLSVALAATALIVTAGALAGFFPAYRAARVNPIVALRAE